MNRRELFKNGLFGSFGALLGVNKKPKKERVWTDLKDCEGNKIYIGSIVYEPHWWWGAGEVIRGRKDNSVPIVRSKEGCFIYNAWNLDQIKVIGHVDTEPELVGFGERML